MRVVEQDPHQLRHRHRRVRIVQLDRDLLRKRVPIGVAAPEAPYEIGQRAGDQKILLNKAQCLSHARGVVGIQHPRQGFGCESAGQRSDEIAAAECLKVEIVGRSCRPQPQRIDGLAAVADHGPIKRDTDQRGGPAGYGAQLSTDHLERAVEFDFDRLVGTRDLPGILPTQPVVRLFMLPAVLDGLFEDAVFVTQPIAHRRQLHRRHRVEKASRKAPEPAVSEAGVGFFFDEAEPIDVLLLGNSLREGIKQKVGDIVGQRAPDQKFHRQVVDPLRVLAVVGAFCPHPAL